MRSTLPRSSPRRTRRRSRSASRISSPRALTRAHRRDFADPPCQEIDVMPGTKEIRAKIASVKSTQKITKAMQMVATSKMRRAQERMRLARPYAQKMLNVIGHLTEANPDYRQPFLVAREPKAVGIIVISTDRGLAGALNANVFRQTLHLMRDWQRQEVAVKLCLIGTKALNFF